MTNPQELLNIGLKKRNGELTESWSELAEQHGNGFFTDGEQFRCWVKNRLRSGTVTQNKTNLESTYKESSEIHKDGSQTSNKLVKMSFEQKKDPTFLLQAHGFDPDTWELINAKNSEWTGYSKQDGQFPQYSSKITVKPKSSGFSMDKLLEATHKISPVYIKTTHRELTEKRLLELSFFDQHFGISDYEYYKPTLDDTIDIIESAHREEILIIIGQDLLHHDNFRSQTASGTTIENVDIVKAWEDAKAFYSHLINASIPKSNKVKVIYSKGNHDESLSWGFVQTLKAMYPQVEFDDSFVERKAHVFGEVFIGITHGDKAKKNLHNIFPVEFPMEWAKAKTREIHTGHLHTEDAKDVYGMMIRTLSTRNKTDAWHRDNGFVGGHKRFMLFEYNETALKSIHYV